MGLCAVFPGRVAVFGMRGTQSVDVFLALYGPWLKSNRPAVLLIGDNDEAGRRWSEPVREPLKLPKPCFVDRLKTWGCRRVVSAYPPPDAGNDFNDFYRARNPDPAFMADWLDRLKLS